MSPMRRSVLVTLSAVAALAACDMEQQPPAADTSAAAPAAATAAGMSTEASALLAEQAGTWDGQSMPMDSDSVVTTWRMITTADTTGWTITMPGVPTIPMRVVAVGGDSVVTDFGPYERPEADGDTLHVQNVRAVGRMENGQRVGTYVATLASPDTVVRGRYRGTRAP